MTTGSAMTLCIVASGLAVAAMIWMGPETRGKQFSAVDEEARSGTAGQDVSAET